jgi:hypothetical protein
MDLINQEETESVDVRFHLWMSLLALLHKLNLTFDFSPFSNK